MNTLIEMPQNKPRDAEAEFDRRMELVMTSVDLHHLHLRDYLFQLTHQFQDAEDLVQELWKYVLHNFPEDKIVSLSLLRVKAKQLCLDRWRAAKRRPQIVTDEIPEVLESVSRELAFSDAEEKRLKERFWQEFYGIQLSEPQKEVIWLHGRYSFTYQEIEQQTGVPSSTVGDWIAKGRQLITEYLNHNE